MAANTKSTEETAEHVQLTNVIAETEFVRQSAVQPHSDRKCWPHNVATIIVCELGGSQFNASAPVGL